MNQNNFDELKKLCFYDKLSWNCSPIYDLKYFYLIVNMDYFSMISYIDDNEIKTINSLNKFYVPLQKNN